MDQSILFNILVVAVLIFANAFFVASEFALVKVRKTKLEQLSNEGSSTAKVALDTVENMNDMLAAIQLGIPKRYLVIVHEIGEEEFDTYIICNPKIISTSSEKIYVEMGKQNKKIKE